MATLAPAERPVAGRCRHLLVQLLLNLEGASVTREARSAPCLTSTGVKPTGSRTHWWLYSGIPFRDLNARI